MIEEMHREQVLHGIDRLLPELRQAREAQLEKWGIQEHDPALWLAILGEEHGVVAKEVAEGQFGSLNLAKYREECLHTAAVAMAMVQCIDDGQA